MGTDSMRRAPGTIRDSVSSYLARVGQASISDITEAVEAHIGQVAPSSVRSCLNLNVPDVFERASRGIYRLSEIKQRKPTDAAFLTAKVGFAELVHADCFDWLSSQPDNSIHAVVTDPPYGLVEYSKKEQQKLRNGSGGVWRIPPSFDGSQRSPLPRFTTLTEKDRIEMRKLFRDLGRDLMRVLVPGANVVVAANPLLHSLVTESLSENGLEIRGTIVRMVMTMRGGDRPKNAHQEFHDVSVMPRSMFEPWAILRKPLDGRVQDNLRAWGTGGFRRKSGAQPFGDVIKSERTPRRERDIVDHPSLKPQSFMRQIVRAALPLGEGIVLDPFSGGGSTLAAANAVGYRSIGVELDMQYFKRAQHGIEKLADLSVKSD